MSLLAPINFRKAGQEDYSAAILDRETTWGEFHGAMLREGWWNSLPGQFFAELGLPQNALSTSLRQQAGESTLAGIDADMAERERMRGDLEAGTVDLQAERQRIEDDLTRRNIGFLTEEQWRASPFYREDMPFEPFTTPARAAAMAEVHDRAKFRERLLARRQMGLTDYVTGFGAAMIGGLPDPTNLVAFGALRSAWALRAASRMGRVLRMGAVGAGENVLATGIQLPLLAASQAHYGDEMTWGDALLDMATAAALGLGLAGGVHGIGELRRGRQDVLRARQQAAAQAGQEAVAALRDGQAQPDLLSIGRDGGGVAQPWRAEANVGWHQAQESLAAIHLAARDLAETGQVSVARLLEKQDVESAYNLTRLGVRGGAFDFVARVTRDAIEHAFVALGGWKGHGDVTVRGAGFGLAKVIFKHGEGSNVPPALQVTKDDVLDFVDVYKDFDPSPQTKYQRNDVYRVLKKDGRTVVYAVKRLPQAPGGGKAVVTIFVEDPGRPPTGVPYSPKRGAGGPGSSVDLSRASGDTGQVLSQSDAGGQGVPAPLNVEAAVVFRNLEGRPLEPDWTAETRAAVEQAKAEAGLDAEGGFPEQAQFEAMKAAGALTKEELAAYDAAQAEAKRLAKSPEAFDAAAACVIGGAT